MIDLTKPIRRRDDKRPACVTPMRCAGHWLVEYQASDSDWTWAVFREQNMQATFENVPPPQEWRWEDVRGYIGSARYESAAEAHSSCRHYAGQPVRILREGETP